MFLFKLCVVTNISLQKYHNHDKCKNNTKTFFQLLLQPFLIFFVFEIVIQIVVKSVTCKMDLYYLGIAFLWDWREFSSNNVFCFRYIAICYPLVHRNLSHSYTIAKRVAFYTIPVMILSILINLPKFWETRVVSESRQKERFATVRNAFA